MKVVAKVHGQSIDGFVRWSCAHILDQLKREGFPLCARGDIDFCFEFDSSPRSGPEFRAQKIAVEVRRTVPETEEQSRFFSILEKCFEASQFGLEAEVFYGLLPATA